MMTPSSSQFSLAYLVVGLVAFLHQGIRASSSSSSSHNSNDNSLHHHQPDITAFTFRSRKNPLLPKNDGYYYHHHDKNDHTATTADESRIMDSNDDESSSIVCSSLLYDGGCVVSAQAIMCCSGGENSAVIDFHDEYDHESEEEEDDDEDEDDDDDDNDGHSSMLSNASLRRSERAKVTAGSSSSSDYYPPSSSRRPQEQDQQQSRRSAAAFLRRYTRSFPSSATSPISSSSLLSKSTTSSNEALVLSIRGGAAAAAGGGGIVSELGSEFAKKLFVTALVTLIYEGMIGHILEFVKICMQTAPDGTTNAQVLRTITAEKGIGGLWDGFVPWGVIQSVFKGSVFGLAHAVASSLLVPLAEKEGSILPMSVAKTLAGGIGGGFQGFVLSPTLLLKTRVMTSPVFREKMSLWKTTLMSARVGFDVVATEGIGALMKGAGVFSTKRVCDWASRYYFSDLFESLAVTYYKKGGTLAFMEKSACSLLGGTASTIVTLPLDVLVAKIQDAKKAGVQSSAWQMFQDELNEKGWSRLMDSYMKGFEVRLLHVALTTVAVKTGVPIAYDLIYGTKK